MNIIAIDFSKESPAYQIVGSATVRHYLLGLVCITSYSNTQIDMKWLRVQREIKDRNFYFQYTLPFAFISGETLHTVMFVLRKRKVYG